MSFSGSCVEIREAIKQACKETGFNPILVDEIDPGMTNTINDAIVANLKKCKFCIADFTEQKDGVYFESGFALGQGKRVIYTCKEDWFNKSHFDINHFPHIIYPNVAELKRQLVDRINAWITQ
jgi:nucleoside 2-deoxyribosyltransferase